MPFYKSDQVCVRLRAVVVNFTSVEAGVVDKAIYTMYIAVYIRMLPLLVIIDMYNCTANLLALGSYV